MASANICNNLTAMHIITTKRIYDEIRFRMEIVSEIVRRVAIYKVITVAIMWLTKSNKAEWYLVGFAGSIAAVP